MGTMLTGLTGALPLPFTAGDGTGEGEASTLGASGAASGAGEGASPHPPASSVAAVAAVDALSGVESAHELGVEVAAGGAGEEEPLA